MSSNSNIGISSNSLLNKTKKLRNNIISSTTSIGNRTKKTVSNTYNKSRSAFRKMSYVKITWIVVLLILVIVILVFWGQSVSNIKQQNNLYSPILISNPVNAAPPLSKPINFTLHKSLEGYDFSFSMWIYINDWNYRFGEWKTILQSGTSPDFIPYIGLYKNTNTLHARMSTHSSPNEGCDIQNIPIQKWVNIIYILNNRTVSIYINGKLERSCVLLGVPKIDVDNSRTTKICPDGGFGGQISRVQYFTKAITQYQIKDIYDYGPYGDTKYNITLFSDELNNLEEAF